MLQVGQTQCQVAQHFGCSVKTINDLWQRFNQTGTTSDRPRSVRPRVTTPREDRRIRLLHLGNRFVPATVTARNLPDRRISAQTVRNRLRSTSLRSRRPYNYTGPVLTRRHRTNRLNWARAHRRWLLREWNSVLFSDGLFDLWWWEATSVTTSWRTLRRPLHRPTWQLWRRERHGLGRYLRR